MGKTEEKAKEVVRDYFYNGDLKNLLRRVSDLSVWFGRFGASNRNRFLDSLFAELDSLKATNKSGEES